MIGLASSATNKDLKKVLFSYNPYNGVITLAIHPTKFVYLKRLLSSHRIDRRARDHIFHVRGSFPTYAVELSSLGQLQLVRLPRNIG